MKRKITLSIALVMSIVLVALTSSDSTVKGQGSDHAWGSFATLGPNQILRITVVNTDRNRNANIRFGRQSYTQEMCNGDGVCKLAVASQTTSAPITLMPGEAASFDIPNTAFGVRAVVLSNRQDMRINASIIDSATGEVVSIFQCLVTNEI